MQLVDLVLAPTEARGRHWDGRLPGLCVFFNYTQGCIDDTNLLESGLCRLCNATRPLESNFESRPLKATPDGFGYEEGRGG